MAVLCAYKSTCERGNWSAPDQAPACCSVSLLEVYLHEILQMGTAERVLTTRGRRIPRRDAHTVLRAHVLQRRHRRRVPRRVQPQPQLPLLCSDIRPACRAVDSRVPAAIYRHIILHSGMPEHASMVDPSVRTTVEGLCHALRSSPHFTHALGCGSAGRTARQVPPGCCSGTGTCGRGPPERMGWAERAMRVLARAVQHQAPLRQALQRRAPRAAVPGGHVWAAARPAPCDLKKFAGTVQS